MRRNEIPDSLSDPTIWPGVDPSALGKERRVIYQLREQAVHAYLLGTPLTQIERDFGVNRGTLQHTRYANVFSLGDASSLPTSKTAAAIRAQSPVLVANLRAVMAGRSPRAVYNGYTSCPLITGYGRLILAEFDYDLQACETFPFDQGRERKSMYLLKKYFMPALYWRALVRGRKWPWPVPESAPSEI